jgi:MOSC domain-containing protein YiiM
MLEGKVVAVCMKAEPGLPKLPVEMIELVAGMGIAGDYHYGRTVRHRFLAKKDPSKLNQRQVLLLDTSIYAALAQQGIALEPGSMGENILVDGLQVMGLALGTLMAVGPARLEVTELRNPCYQLNGMHPRLLKAVAYKRDGRVIFQAGVMGRILTGGPVRPGDLIRIK